MDTVLHLQIVGRHRHLFRFFSTKSASKKKGAATPLTKEKKSRTHPFWDQTNSKMEKSQETTSSIEFNQPKPPQKKHTPSATTFTISCGASTKMLWSLVQWKVPSLEEVQLQSQASSAWNFWWLGVLFYQGHSSKCWKQMLMNVKELFTYAGERSRKRQFYIHL